jgi:Chaperonin 10 Kd subunit
VLFDRTSATEVKIDGVEYLIMKESDVLAVVKHFQFANDGNRSRIFTQRLPLLVTGALLAVVIGLVTARAIGIV